MEASILWLVRCYVVHALHLHCMPFRLGQRFETKEVSNDEFTIRLFHYCKVDLQIDILTQSKLL